MTLEDIKQDDKLKIKFADYCLSILPYTPMFTLVNDFLEQLNKENEKNLTDFNGPRKPYSP